MCASDTSSALLQVEPETWKAAAILQPSRAEISGPQVTGWAAGDRRSSPGPEQLEEAAAAFALYLT